MVHHYCLYPGNQLPPVHKGHYDQWDVALTIVKNIHSTFPLGYGMPYGEIKEMLIEVGSELAPFKEKINAISPARYQTNAARRLDNYGIDRGSMILDFDNNPNLDAIQSKLAPFVYAMWTTYKHQLPGIGPRYRVFLPLNQPITQQEWKNGGAERFQKYFENLEFVADCAIDHTAYTFGQLAILPSINPAVGRVELWFNDSADTAPFSVALLPKQVQQLLPTVSRQTDQTSQIIQNPYESMDWQSSIEEMAYLIGYLEKKDALWSIPACPIIGDHGLNRKTIAAALQSIGANYGDFCQLDTVMRKHDTHTDSRRAWADGTKVNTKSHPGILLKLLTPMERKLCGLEGTTSKIR